MLFSCKYGIVWIKYDIFMLPATTQCRLCLTKKNNGKINQCKIFVLLA